MPSELIHLLLGVVWGLYYGLHSLLATTSCKRFFYTRLGLGPSGYRVVYNFLALLGFGLIWRGQGQLVAVELWENPIWLQLVGGGFMLAGILLGGIGLRGYDLGEFSGLGRRTEEEVPLQTQGLNAYVRHPLYSAGMLLLLGFALFRPLSTYGVFVGISCLYLRVGAGWEERKLTLRYGDAYTEYQQRVGRFIPFL